MRSGIRAAVIGVLMVAASLTIKAGAPQSESGEIQLQLARQFFADGRYLDALGAFQAALTLARILGCADEGREERMWLERLAEELRMALATEEPRVIRKLDNLDKIQSAVLVNIFT